MIVVDLFCGGGGFSVGAKKAGHTVVMAVDNWVTALECHELYSPDTAHYNMVLGGDLQDMVKLINKHIQAGDRWHLHGSPPCQKLSSANRTSGDSQEGMRLVNWYLSLVTLCNPTSWSMEQVIGATHFLRSSDYEQYHIINTKDFGIPQTRRRLFIGKGWTLPTTPYPTPRSLSDALPYIAEQGSLIKGYKNTVALKQNGTHLGNRKLVGLEGFKTINEPTYTVCAAGPLKLFRYTDNVPTFVRDLTPEEHLVIQGFPPDYMIPTHLSKGARYKVIGNAVSPAIAFLIMSTTC